MCIQAHAHTWRWTLIPPTPTKNFKVQLLLQAKLWHIIHFDVKANMYPMQSKYNTYGGYPKPQPPIKSFNAQLLLQGKIWHITFLDEKPHMYPMKR